MTFLNPAMLWGLLAVSIPILIHIFNLKKTKKFEFSTLMFLKEIQQSKYKKIKLKQLLILLCRILMIIFLVLAFSQPFETGYLGKAGEKTPSSALVILDNSFSMLARDVQGTYFEIAKKKASELLDLLGENDEIYFTTVSAIAEGSARPYFGERETVKDSITNSRVSDITKSLNDVIYHANSIVENFSKSYKEIYLITDAQRSFIEGSPIESKFSTPDLLHFNVIDIGKRTGNNISLDTINVITKIFEKNKDVRLKCVVNNRNNFNVSGKSVTLNFGSYREEKVVDIPANSSVEVEFKFKPDLSGFSGGFIELAQSEISDDEISRDNKRYFSIYTPDKINLLIISSSSADAQFIKLALNSYEDIIKETNEPGSKFFNIKEAGDVASENLESYNSVVILNKPRFNAAEGDKVKSYVENGGGVIVFPGENVDIGNYNDVLMSKLELPYINGTFGDVSGTHVYKFDKIDLEHPVIEGIYKQQADIRKNFMQESPSVKFGISLLTQANSLPVIVLDNEKYFLVEYSRGNGKVLFYSIPPDMSYSDFPAASLFSPLVIRSIMYPSNKFSIKEATAGRDYFLDLGALNLPSGIDSLYIAGSVLNISDSKDFINLKNTLNQVSNYTVQAETGTVYEFPCNFDKRESDLQKMPAGEAKEMLEKSLDIDVNVIKSDEKLTASITALRTGKQIWQYFLILALACIAGEYYLAKSLMK